jgi:hypothetical protein
MIRTDARALRGSLDGVELGEDGVPVAFRIWRAGSNPTDKGDTVFTSRSAKRLLEEQETRGNLYSIDFDHASLDPHAPPEARRAAGFHKLAVRNGELWAVDVEWTDVARAGLAKDPPEFRYFSPAYDVDKKSAEVVAYLNTALTNNPATWNVTALANRTGSTRETTIMANENEKPPGDEMAAAIKKMGKKAALEAVKAAFPDEPDGDEPKKKEEEAARAAAVTASAGDDDEKKKKEEEAKRAAASYEEEQKKSSAIAATAAKVEKHDKQLEQIAATAENTARESLLATRPDLSAEQLKTLRKKTSAELPEILALIPVPPGRGRPNTVPSVERAATRGEGQGDDGDVLGMRATRKSEHAERLDSIMFGKREPNPVRHEGTSLVCSVMTPSQARAHVKRIEARAATAAKQEAK